MTPEQLKASILQMAIEGKLVEQRPEEGTGEDLYQQIQAEKEKLISEGKIKKQKLLPEIEEDETPFKLPSTWKWIRLGSCIDLLSGQDLTRSRYNAKKQGIVYLTGASNILDNGEILINRWTTSPTSIAYQGNLLLTCKGTIGKLTILNIEKAHIARQIMAITEICVLVDYLKYFLSISIEVIKKSARSMIPGIDRETILELRFPLPPLAEQKRIVAKIEELLPLVDKYAEAYEKLEKLNAEFPEKMKKSVLQYAIQGKLVEQRPEEGTAEELYQKIQAEKEKLISEGKLKKQKPLPEIKEDEISFYIPESWKLVYIGDIFSHNTGKALNRANREGSLLEYLTTSNVYWDNFNLDKLKKMYFKKDELEKYSIKKGDLLVCEGGDVGRSAIWNCDYPVCIQNHLHKLRKYGNVDTKFYLHIFWIYKNLKILKGKGIGIKGLSSRELHCLIVPLPPLAEQKRIVAKIEEYFNVIASLGFENQS